ncbi:MAG: phosphoribosyltransferase family protein, partial [Bacteroidota bacterium]
MLNENNLILDHQQTLNKIRRIAFEVYEHNFEEEEIIIAGIHDTGYTFAEILVAEFSKIAPIKSKLIKLTLHKVSPTQSEVEIGDKHIDFSNKVIVIADDVLNTGKTIAYSLRPFLKVPVKKIQVAVIVDRNHKSFPVEANFIGYDLSTTVNKHIEVVLENNKS